MRSRPAARSTHVVRACSSVAAASGPTRCRRATAWPPVGWSRTARMSEVPLLEVAGLKRYFDVSPPFLNRVLDGTGRRVIRAVDGVSFRIEKGETFGLVGESGCGKSTIARMVVGLYGPSAGTIELDGVALSPALDGARRAGRPRRVQMIFQDPYASLNPRWPAGPIVAEPLHFRGQLGSEDIRRRVDALLVQVGLSPRDADKYPHEFSGGQRQRISIARAL